MRRICSRIQQLLVGLPTWQLTLDRTDLDLVQLPSQSRYSSRYHAPRTPRTKQPAVEVAPTSILMPLNVTLSVVVALPPAQRGDVWRPWGP